jgi:hypothetical protein
MVLRVVLALAFLGLQQGTGTSNDETSAQQRTSLERQRHQQAANQINDVAERIHSEADAVAFVDQIAEVFGDTLPHNWDTRSIRQQVAHAEFEAISNPSRLIPEQRIADVWNKYVREIGASDEALVTATEIHNLRDADFAVSQLLWSQTNRSIWTMPNVYAVGSAGKVAEGCRAVETLRVLYDLHELFGNLRSARERVRQGILASDEIAKSLNSPAPKQTTTGRLEAHGDTNPLRTAEYRYKQEHGPYILSAVKQKLFDELFPQAD